MIGVLSEGSIVWPNDTFTHNRIRYGDVTVVQEKPKAAAPGQQSPRGGGDAALILLDIATVAVVRIVLAGYAAAFGNLVADFLFGLLG